ncbi:Motile sperm domain-containing protein 2 isoform X1 [Oopsacas minuta]|uniref:Motile sperm domain-containing protein 2 isoform X1 n=1 Tax=Oopsacas minuta TaxID=111878 RepID=A0AAV7KKN8_9METZ|nr:Motile sperm domain-containing protein 2 isoform X1 [Oopsacas minuta]
MATKLPADLPPWEYFDPDLLQQAVSEIRLIFRSKYIDPSACKAVDPRDLQLVQNDPNFVKNFVKQAYFLTPDSSKYPDSTTLYNTVLQSLIFRQEYNVHDLTPRDIPTSVLNLGFCYTYGMDNEGNTIFYLIARKNKRDAELKKASKLYAVYIMYKHSLLCPDQRITFFIDSTGAGISNIDLDFLRFLMDLFQIYFPLRLNWVLVYNMPWVLNATWNIVKRWLPVKARDCLIFTTPNDITNYVDKSQLLSQYGGNATWTYQYPIPYPEADTLLGQLIYIRDEDDERDFMNSFESASVAVSKVTAGDLLDHIEVKDRGDNTLQIPQINRLPLTQVTQESAVAKANELVEISPNGPLVFSANGQPLSPPCTVILSIRNISQHLVAYKIKATNLDSYKVSPTMGVVDLDLTHRINITLNLSKFQSFEKLALEVGRDRFLVMTASYPLDKPTTLGHIMRFWKSIEKDKIGNAIFNTRFEPNSIEKSNSYKGKTNELDELRSKILSSRSALYSLNKRLNFLMQTLWILSLIVAVNLSVLLWRTL